MREPKFKPGDRVRHLGSGQYAVVLGLGSKCVEHPWAPRNFPEKCYEWQNNPECRFEFDGRYLVETGIGEKSSWASEVSLTAAEELPS